MLDLIALVDCESSGLPRKDLPPDHQSQPRLLQLACKVTTADRRVVSNFSRIIRPEGWTIEPEAEKVHGISNAFALATGSPMWFALAELRISLNDVTRIVGFNFQFDRTIIEREARIIGAEMRWWRPLMPKVYDCMEAATPILKLPNPQMPGEHKWPTLEEAINWYRDRHQIANGSNMPERFVSTHDAAQDNDATEELYWNLQEASVQAPYSPADALLNAGDMR